MNKRSHLMLALAICCTSSSVLMPLPSTAKTSTELKSDKKDVDAQLKQLKQELQTMNRQFDEYVDTYDTLQQNITDIEASIAVSKEDVASRQKIIAKRMKAYQAQDSSLSPYVEAVLGADSFTDLVTRTLSVKKIIDADEQLRDQQKDETAALKKKHTQLLQKETQLDEQFQMMQEAYEALVIKRAENKAKSLKLKEKIASTEEKEKLERQRKKAEKRLAAMKKAQAEQAQALKKAKQQAKEAEEKAAKQQAEAEEARQAQAAAEAEAQAAQAAQAQAETAAASAVTTDTTTTAAPTDTTATTTTDTTSTTNTTVTSNDNTSTDTPTVSGSPKAQAIIAEASKYLGRKYVWGGSSPTTGFDCSGLTSWSYKQNGISIPRTAAQQYAASTKISASEAKAGDLVFFSYGKGVAHVGIYLGNGEMINAQNSGLKTAKLAGYWSKYIVGYGRFAGVN